MTSEVAQLSYLYPFMAAISKQGIDDIFVFCNLSKQALKAGQ